MSTDDPLDLNNWRPVRDLRLLHLFGPCVLYEICSALVHGRGIVETADWRVHHRLAAFHTCGPRAVFGVLDRGGHALLSRTDIDRIVTAFCREGS